MIEIKNADCMVEMAVMKDKQFDLAIVDPPYGETVKQGGYMSNKMGNKKHQHAYHNALWKQEKPTEEYFRELFRVSKNQIIWGANHFISRFFKDSPCWIIWDKCRTEQHWADAELAYCSFDSAAKIFKFAWDGFRQGDMKNKEVRIHPTQKPVALYKWLLSKYAKEGDTILDTHLGSGSIALACHDMGFALTAFEIDKEYYDASLERLARHQAQGRFDFG